MAELYVANCISSLYCIHIYAGPPLPPALTMRIIKANELLLEWEEPFTWPGHDILGYKVGVVSTERGNVTFYNTSQQSHTYKSLLMGVEREECEQLTFTVSAVSDVGWGQPSTIASSLPIGECNTELCIVTILMRVQLHSLTLVDTTVITYIKVSVGRVWQY